VTHENRRHKEISRRGVGGKIRVSGLVKLWVASTGGNLGGIGGGVGPPKFEVGDSPCIRPQIFREVLLLDVRQSTN